jgi:cytochrome c oxidase accessory protein FixG
MDITNPPTPVETVDVSPVNKRGNRGLHKKREKIHPKRAYGAFRSTKWIVMAITLTIYYVTPWLRWDRGPYAPDQAVLIDFPARRFYFFFIEIWPQEVYLLTGLLVLAAMVLFLTATTVGRAWCGYSCPQTVWTDLFLVVERFFEGDRNARIRLDRAKFSFDKLFRKAGKHVTWLIIAVATGGAWVFYYADAPTLLGQLVTLEAPRASYVWIGILTAFTYVFGGFAREQVCTYMCPWPRIQAALADEESLIVTYDRDRGEPRGPHHKGDTWEGRGDCIDCNQCVVVCPMGIDIRDGLQLECISCALCIDACNDVMRKIERPGNLIAYGTLRMADQRARGEPVKYRILRGRTMLYAGMIVLVSIVMLTALLSRADLELSVLRDRNPLFTMLSDGGVRNGFTLKISNKTHQPRTYVLSVDGLTGAVVSRVGGRGDLPLPEFRVGPDQVQSFRIFVTSQGKPATDSIPIVFTLSDSDSDTLGTENSTFRGPAK